MNFAKAESSWAIALISNATLIIFMVFLLILPAFIGVTRAKPKAGFQGRTGKATPPRSGAKLHKRSAEASRLEGFA